MRSDGTIFTESKVQKFNESVGELVSYRGGWASLVDANKLKIVGGEAKVFEMLDADIMDGTFDMSLATGQETEVNHFKTEQEKFKYKKVRVKIKHNVSDNDANEVDMTRVSASAVNNMNKLFDGNITASAAGRIKPLDPAEAGTPVVVSTYQALLDAINRGYSKFLKLNRDAGFEVNKSSVRFLTSLDVESATMGIIDQSTSVRDILMKTYGTTYIDDNTYQAEFQNLQVVENGVYFVNNNLVEIYAGDQPQLTTPGKNVEEDYTYYKYHYDIPALRTAKNTGVAVGFLPLDVSALVS